MGEQAKGQPPTPEQQAAFARKLAELEALGVATEALRKTLAERPQDFEREADAAMRRELLGEEAAPEEPPAELPAEEPIRISGAGEEPAAPPSQAPADGAALETPPPHAEPEAAAEPAPPPAEPLVEAPPALPPEEAPADSLAEIEAKMAAFLAETPSEPSTAPAPVVLEEAEPPGVGVESDLSAVLDEALREAPPSSQDEPPLAEGDSLSLGAAPPPRPPVEPGAKPPPPTGRAPSPERVVVRKAAPPAAPSATEVLPAEPPRRGRAGKSAAGLAVVILVLAGTYLLLVNTAPTAAFSFSPTAPVAGESVVFSANATTDPNGDPLTFRWQFGDGSANATGAVARYTFPRSGNYTVTLTATDNHKNAATATRTVPVLAGSITPPIYAYGERLDYTVNGRSHVAGVFAPLGSANFTFGQFSGSCSILAVDLNFDGPQSRAVLQDTATALDGFLDPHTTYVLERSLPNLRLLGQVNLSTADCPVGVAAYSGNAELLERAFVNPNHNDTVRGEASEQAAISVDTSPPRAFDSSAALTDFPKLDEAADQLHLESAYAGRTFSTEVRSSGSFTAEGLHWNWITHETSVVGGALAIKIHFEPDNLPPTIFALSVDLWVSSTSAFPVREYYHVRGVSEGRSYESTFDATATGPGLAGIAPIPFTALPRSYRTVNATEVAPLTQVPRSLAGPDFNFTARTAFDEGIARCPDFAGFMLNNSNAYAINGTYSRSTGNPKWTLDFSEDPAGTAARLEDEHSSVTQVRCGGAPDSANLTRSQVGAVVSLNYAADLMKREETAAALFPANAFDAARANFTIRQQKGLPTVSVNAALTASRAAVPYAFGAENLEHLTLRTTAYVDAQTGQLVYVLRETGEPLP